MGERTSYAPGTFSWADVTTTDQEGAKAFYTALFGWEIEDLPVGDGVSYSMARFDVMTAGRMAVIADPQGAFLMAWEPRESIGARFVNAPGALAWNELATPDVDAAIRFYGDLFGWATEPFEGSPQRYLVVKNGDRGNGGIRELGDQPAPPHWLPYFPGGDLHPGVAQGQGAGRAQH